MIETTGPPVLPPRVIGVIYVATGLLLLLLLREPTHQLEKPGSRGFTIAVIAIAIWPLSHGINVFVSDLGSSMGLWNVRLLAAGLVSVGWFLLAFEFTTQKFPSRRIVIVLVGYLLTVQLVAWTNSTHNLVLDPGTTIENGVLVPVFGSLFWAQATINYALIVGATTLLVVDALTAETPRYRQSAVLAAAVMPPLVANAVTILNVVETVYDLTPIGLIGSGLLLSWALYRMEVLDVSPVARAVAVERMRDAVVTINDEDRVVYCNGAARRLSGVGDDYFGLPARAFLGSISDELLAHHEDGGNIQTEITTHLNDEPQHFLLSLSPIRRGSDRSLGQVIVLREITQLKQREQELNLTRQVLSRVLRHNLRTELNNIQGYAELLDDEEECNTEYVDPILESCDDLLTTSENTRHIERIIAADAEPERYDLRQVVDDTVAEVGEQYPGVRTEVAGTERRLVRTSPGVEIAITAIVENAAEHNTAAEPEIRVSIASDEDSCTLQVADNGPGIPEHELAVLEDREETQLSHGSGVGLWLLEWWTSRAGVETSFEVGADGTTITLRFPEPLLA